MKNGQIGRHGLGKHAVLMLLLSQVSLGLACGFGDELKTLDLEAPRLLAVELPSSGVISVTARLRLQFSEAVDPASLTTDAAVLVPFRREGPCADGMPCRLGVCYAGSCQQAVVNETWKQDFHRLPLSAARAAQAVALALQPEDQDAQVTAPQARVLAVPQRLLAPHQLYTLLINDTVTDVAGNPLFCPESQILPYSQLVATSGPAVGAPVVRWVAPRSEVAADPEVARIVLSSSKPLRGVRVGSFWLETATGAQLALSPQAELPSCHVAAQPWDNCLVLQPEGRLGPAMQWRLKADPMLQDDLQQSVVVDPQAVLNTAERSSPAPQPTLRPQWRVGDGCVTLVAQTPAAPLALWLSGSWPGAARQLSLDADVHELALSLQGVSPGAELQLDVWNLRGELVQQASFAPPSDVTAPLIISEILANPRGPEPQQELVELLNRSDGTIDVGGWTLDDNDDGRGRVTLPSARLEPGRYAVVVGPGYQPENADGQLAKQALLLQLKLPIGERGLANTLTESVVLANPQGRHVSSFAATGALAPAQDGQSYQRWPVTACDLPSSWRASLPGQATPGAPALR